MGKINRHAGKFLVDTSTWIYALKPSSDDELRNKIRSHISKDEIVTTPLIILELLTGAKTKKEYDNLKKELEALLQIHPDDALWDKIYEAGFQLCRKGITVPVVDLIIALTASQNNCILIHHDHHYKLLADSNIISLQEQALPALSE